MAFFQVFSCSKPLKEPPGKIYGTVTLSPDPGPGENWAYVNASSELAEYEVISDPVNHTFAFENLKVVDLYTKYYLEASRPGYITYGDTILIEAGATISNFNIVLRHGSSQSATFQDGTSPDPAYRGCLDTYISFPDTQQTSGGEASIAIAGGAPNTLSRGLIHFYFNWQSYFPTFDSIPGEIQSATLRIYVDSVLTYGSVTLGVFNLEQAFNENQSNWSVNGPNPWPGGPGGSWGSLSSDTVSVGILTTGWVDFSIDAIAESWLTDRDPGPMMIKLIDESRLSAIFVRSADNDSTALRPTLSLVINYPQ
ncbi:MAG: DNRLRE domain-containing protein [candidate division Zixibacteria bacterium]